MEKVYDLKGEIKWIKSWNDSRLFYSENQLLLKSFSILLTLSESQKKDWQSDQVLILSISDLITRRKKMQGQDLQCFPILYQSQKKSDLLIIVKKMGFAIGFKQLKSKLESIPDNIWKDDFIQLYKKDIIAITSEGPRRWILKITGLVQALIQELREKRIGFVPEKYGNISIRSLLSLSDCCISASSNLGTTIPAYDCGSCGALWVQLEQPDICNSCGSNRIYPTTDKLDEKFFSALHFIAALKSIEGKNKTDTKDYNTFSLLITSVENFPLPIIYIMALGLYMNKVVPFREVLLNTGLKGITHSTYQLKVPTGPKNIIDRFGADVFRFSLLLHFTPGKTTYFSDHRIKTSMAFINKIWNACRYITQTSKDTEDLEIDFTRLKNTDQWILHLLNTMVDKINDFMDNCQFKKAALLIYSFIRHEFCKWYLEFSKMDIHNPETKKTLKFAVNRLIQLLHPFIPFVTEELNRKINTQKNDFLLNQPFPAFNSEFVFSIAFYEIEILKKLIYSVRKIRSENRIPNKKMIQIYLKTESEKESSAIVRNIRYLKSLTGSKKIEIVPDFSLIDKGFKGSPLNWEILIPFDNNKERIQTLSYLQEKLTQLDREINDLEISLSSSHLNKKDQQHVMLKIKKSIQKKIDYRNKIKKDIDDLS